MMEEYDLLAVMQELDKIRDVEIKQLFLDNKIKEVCAKMELHGESFYVNNPEEAYSDLNTVLHDNPRVRFYNELIFLKKMISKN